VYNHLNPEIVIPKCHLRKIYRVILAAKSKFPGVAVVNYFISGNHFHLQLFFGKDCKCTLSKFMQWLGTELAKTVNKILKRHGKVFRDPSSMIKCTTVRNDHRSYPRWSWHRNMSTYLRKSEKN
jgi:energy-coupling factor transporter ATP-binding protein EcfA2